MREADPDGAWSFARDLWYREGIVVLMPDQVEARRGWVAARMALNLGETVYGKRKG